MDKNAQKIVCNLTYERVKKMAECRYSCEISLGCGCRYDGCKTVVLRSGFVEEGPTVHVVASVAAAFLGTLLSNPADVVMTRWSSAPTMGRCVFAVALYPSQTLVVASAFAKKVTRRMFGTDGEVQLYNCTIVPVICCSAGITPTSLTVPSPLFEKKGLAFCFAGGPCFSCVLRHCSV